MVKKVGIVGMGLMGQAFILNMRKSQFIIQGFDVDSNRMDELREQGGTPVNTPADAAKDVDCCLLYTSPSPRDGLLSRMPSSA